MPEHDCKHESDIAVIAEKITQILANQIEIKGVIFGNGKEGIRQQQSRLGTIQKIQWWAIGLILVTIGGIVAKNLL